MSFVEAIRLALSQLRAQLLKSFFTLIGVTISVMFLIAIVSIVDGMSAYVEDAFAGKFLGVNTFNVRRFPDFQTGDVTAAEWRAWQRRPKIRIEDGLAIRQSLPEGARWSLHDVRWLAPTTRYSSGGPQVLANASTAGYFRIKNLTVTGGRLFTEQEDQIGAPVVVIGADVAKDYFPGVDPIGKELKIDGYPFRVIGIMEKQGSVFGLNLDSQLWAPFNSPMSRFTHARENLYGVVIQAPSSAATDEVKEAVREVMRRRHHLRPGEPDDFVLESSASALSAWDKIKSYLVLAGVVLPTIGLVVGAIVIMNIMLVAVAERTREIGIRKSLGARRRDILAQFLVESATLSTIGAAIGVALGYGLSHLISALSPLPTHVAPWSIGLAVAIGAGVGIVAGLYPASRASRLDPIIALRAD
ncbi:MAG TPA: ABC transporter permease [Gemmatimonadales bacterium]|nr:ABC transporter permease [Gemmatimonadales bacterium]